MAEVDTAVPFVMNGARAAIAGGMQHIEEHVKGIERAVSENPGLAFDLAKTLIESACRTILTERRIPFEPADDLPRLFRMATNSLSFLPPTASTEAEVRKSLAQTLSGLNTAIQGVCELRNQCGFASHGTGGPRPAMESVQALLVAGTADAIVGFLYRVHRQGGAPAEDGRVAYEDNQEFNDYIDDMHAEVRVFSEEFAPSRILYELAPEPYRVYLTDFRLAEVAEPAESEAEGSGAPS
jgi:hypothetical protein